MYENGNQGLNQKRKLIDIQRYKEEYYYYYYYYNYNYLFYFYLGENHKLLNKLFPNYFQVIKY